LAAAGEDCRVGARGVHGDGSADAGRGPARLSRLIVSRSWRETITLSRYNTPMHIKTICPRCETTFQVDPALRGKKMRCPTAACRAVFEVRESGDLPAPAAPPAPTAAPPPSARPSGSVTDFVPMLQAEAIEAAPHPPPAPPPPPKRPARVEGLTTPPPVRTR